LSAPEGGAGQLRLEVVAGNAAGFTLVVDERLVIGRQSEGPGRLADDPELSRHHAKISRQGDGMYAIEDLASTNGTVVNGERIQAPTVLAVQDSVEVGGTTIVVADAPAAPVTATVDARSTPGTVDKPPGVRDAAPAPAPAPPPPTEVPLAAPAPPAAPEPATVETSRQPRLALRLVVDPEQGEAEIQLGDEAEPIRLSFRDGRWQAGDSAS
jgi:pSer/pThr/pTyr-binding forkhead associated (FHA) protein